MKLMACSGAGAPALLARRAASVCKPLPCLLRRCTAVYASTAAGGAGAAGDAARNKSDALANQTDKFKQAASEAVAATAAATREAALTLVDEAVAGVDSLVGDITSSAPEAKQQAAGSSKAAGTAMDKMVAAVIAQGHDLKATTAAASQPDVAAQLDAAMSKFVARANELRAQLNSQQLEASKVLDQSAAAVAAYGQEMKDIIITSASASSGISIAEIRKQLPSQRASSSGGSGGLIGAILPWLQLWTTLASLYYTDTLIKGVFLQYSIKFPSALAGMFGAFALLCALGDKTAGKVMTMYTPALNWIARWLPLFYVPALVTLPMALDGIPGFDLLRIVGILAVGMVGTLLFTAQITVYIRGVVQTPVKEIAKAKPSPPFLLSHYVAWSAIFVASLIATVFGGPELARQAALPMGLAATVGGYLLGEAVPKAYHGVLHPVVVTAVVANAGAALHGKLMGWSYLTAQKVYLAKVSSDGSLMTLAQSQLVFQRSRTIN
eukprot:GHRR01016047.1.p1 GENE.GHRR01016047.1~~GHRR01016047.1.p1  ORF type:complete len:495 (+),score=199.38 GHRR01016047.1:155-1639(+)